jgi:hypothetical protein
LLGRVEPFYGQLFAAKFSQFSRQEMTKGRFPETEEGPDQAESRCRHEVVYPVRQQVVGKPENQGPML